MTYYRVDFLAAPLILRPAKRFRTKEQAEQHARRILGLTDENGMVSRVKIVAVSRDGTPV